MSLKKSQIVVEELFEQVQEAISVLADQKQIKIEYAPTETVINVDRDRIIQVLVNIISNAIKFSPESSTINVNAQRHNGTVEFKISDQGRGIPKKFLRSIFDRYQQVTSDDSKNARGAGLGLAICKGFVEAHGGEIGVFSEEGKGSTFWFRLPA